MKDAVYKNSRSTDLSIRGTAWRSLYDPGSTVPWPNELNENGNITIYAKTGTAETGKDYRKELIDLRGNKYKNPNYLESRVPNAWYAGYMEYDEGHKISIVVMLENGGKGGKLSADIARQVFKKVIELNRAYGYY